MAMIARKKMRGYVLIGTTLITSFLLGACGPQEVPAANKAAAARVELAPASAPSVHAGPAAEQKSSDATTRQAQQIDLQKQAYAITLGPAMGLSKVTEALLGQQPEEARRLNEELQKRYPDSIEAKGAKAALAR